MDQKTLTGACLCGQITYAIDLPATEPKPKVILCHCTSCKRYTGSGFSANIMIQKPSLRWTSGTPKLFLNPSGDRGIPVPREFCANCGSHFTSAPHGSPWIALKSGTLDEEHRLACSELEMEIYCKRTDAWVEKIADNPVRRAEGMS